MTDTTFAAPCCIKLDTVCDILIAKAPRDAGRNQTGAAERCTFCLVTVHCISCLTGMDWQKYQCLEFDRIALQSLHDSSDTSISIDNHWSPYEHGSSMVVVCDC